MIHIGKRTLRSLAALACVVAAGLVSPQQAVAAEDSCGYGVLQCNYGCQPSLCASLGCTYYQCYQSYQCGFFMVLTVCGGGEE